MTDRSIAIYEYVWAYWSDILQSKLECVSMIMNYATTTSVTLDVLEHFVWLRLFTFNHFRISSNTVSLHKRARWLSATPTLSTASNPSACTWILWRHVKSSTMLNWKWSCLDNIQEKYRPFFQTKQSCRFCNKQRQFINWNKELILPERIQLEQFHHHPQKNIRAAGKINQVTKWTLMMSKTRRHRPNGACLNPP